MPPGRPQRVSDEEILRVFAASSDPVLMRKEVESELDLSNTGTYKRLEDLLDRQLLAAKSTGSSGKIYWLTPEGEKFLESADD